MRYGRSVSDLGGYTNFTKLREDFAPWCRKIVEQLRAARIFFVAASLGEDLGLGEALYALV
jgi:hypothetical protein